MGEFIATTLPAWGMAFADKVARIRNRSGATRTRGQVLVFDLALTVATNYKIGDRESAYVNCVQATAAEDGFGLYCILLEDIEDGQEGRALIWGRALCAFDAGQDPTVVGIGCGSNGATFGLDGTSYNSAGKVTAYAEETTAMKPAGSLFRVLFNGIYGMGKG